MTSRPDRLSLPDEVVRIATRLEEAGYETWCVGGAVRDALLGGGRGDVDLATAARPEQVQALFRRTVPIGLRFGTVGVLDKAGVLHEVTTFRADVSTDGRHAVVAFGVSIDEDLARRDFTVNAIAYHPLRHEWRDPFDGFADLERGTIRAVGDARTRFLEDYLRILRAIRFSCRLEFSIDEATWDAAKAVADGLGRLSAERVRDEWFKSLTTARRLEPLFARWREIGAADRWLGGLQGDQPFVDPGMSWRDPVLLTVAASRDPVGALQTLKASNAEIERARRIVRGPPMPADFQVRTVRRWLAQVEPAGDDLVGLHRIRTGTVAPWDAVVRGIRDRNEPIARGDLAVTGDDLAAAGVPRGPALGRILGELLEVVLDDPAKNRRAQLIEIARKSS